MPNQNPTYTKLTDRGISFGLLRTNPKLTSNVKLTIDSTCSLWLNSIDATADLAQNKYKNFPINPTSNHEVNLFKFYDNGQTPSKISFTIGSTITIDTVAKDLKDQFDFDLYSSGAKYVSSKNYKEKFSYLAPLYLDSVVPEYFVIFKIAGASNYTVGQWKQHVANPTFSSEQFAFDLFKNAIPIKAISLRETSNIGKYIRGILRNPMYPKNPLYVNFKEDKYSVYRGASIDSGTYVEIPELLSSTLRRSIPQLKLEKYITEGFERNNLIYPRILNLEFLFDDDTSDDYTFNRYFGFYCNLIELAQFDIDLVAMAENSEDNDNPLSYSIKADDDLSVTLTNSNGVMLHGIGLTGLLTDLNSAMLDSGSIFFSYLKLKDDSLRFLKKQSISQIGSRAVFSINETSLDLGLAIGPGELFSQEVAEPSIVDTRSTVALTLEQAPNHLDSIRVYHQNGSTFDRDDQYGRYDDIVFVFDDNDPIVDGSVFPNAEEYLINYPTITNVEFDTVDPNVGSPTFAPDTPSELGKQYVSSITGLKWTWDGIQYNKEALGSQIYVNLTNSTINSETDLSKLANAVISVVQNLKDTFLTGKAFKNTAFIQARTPGNVYGQLAVRTISDNTKIKINGSFTSATVYADGGFANTQQAIIPIGNVLRLEPIVNDIVVKTEKNWSMISRICNSVVSIDESDSLDESKVLRYFNNATLMLADNEPTAIDYKKLEIRKLAKPKIGVLSLFEIKDLDFYTYSTQYSKIPEIDLYQNYYIPQGIKLLDFTKYAYSMIGSGQISINEIVYSTTDSSQVVWQNTEGLHEYLVLNGDVILVQSNKVPTNQTVLRHDIPILDEDRSLQNFTGFFSIGADHSLPNKDALTYEYREKFKTNNLASEYHVYLENFSKEFATVNNVVPYISKWGIIDSTDSRGNPYRLNSDIIFGKDNFGPSHRETSPMPEKLTHEWFYIESDFNYSDSIELIKLNNYYFNEPIDVSVLISDSSYFERYFTYIPTFNGIEVERPQFRYSKLTRDTFTNSYSTVFNGAKFNFSEVTTELTANRFADYNFSILLKPIKEDLINSQSPIRYRVIENIDAKSILILIELAVSDLSEINSTLFFDDIARFPDNRIDQTTLFLDGSITNEAIPISIDVNCIYTTANDANGDALFDSILYSSYPSFYALRNDDVTAIDPHNGKEFYDRVPMPGDTIVILKGSSVTTGIIVVFAGSELFTMANAGKLQSGCINRASAASTQYLSVGSQKLGYLRNESAYFRIIKDSSSIANVTLSADNRLIISRSIPGFLSVFGDYRISFNEAGVSNLTYNFLYSAKDKKYNTTKSAYSAVKLATGVDLSFAAIEQNDSNYFISAKPLFGLPENVFTLENFINVASGSHDTISMLGIAGDPSITPPIRAALPAFSPLIFINRTGEVSVLLNTSADFTVTDQLTLQLELSNPGKTSHSLVRVTDNLLTLTKSPTQSTVALKINVVSTGTGSAFNMTSQAIPTGSTATWLTNNQQFQLFGGMGYFSKIFESLSFANFISLLEGTSSLISWESYQNGILIPDRQFVIRIDSADVIDKSTIVTAVPELVETASESTIGGVSHVENVSTGYDLFRYSGEYDIICRTVSGFKQNSVINDISLLGANVFLNPGITDFFVIPEFSFVKYANTNILDFENSQKFEPVYPMIYESPIDHAQYSVLSSSWDFNYHYEYSSKKDKTTIPGSRRITEDYSFISKLLNVPIAFTADSFNSVLLTNSEFEISDSDFLKLTANAELIDLAYSVYVDEIKFRINFSQVISRALSETHELENRLRFEFEKFFKDENSVPIVSDSIALGALTFDEYLYQYCKTNLVKLYALDSLDFYEKADHSLIDNSISIAEIPYDQLDDAGYSAIKTIKINNTNSDIITGSILKKSSSGISLVPKLKIKYI